jgi:hypothetical protein
MVVTGAGCDGNLLRRSLCGRDIDFDYCAGSRDIERSAMDGDRKPNNRQSDGVKVHFQNV